MCGWRTNSCVVRGGAQILVDLELTQVGRHDQNIKVFFLNLWYIPPCFCFCVAAARYVRAVSEQVIFTLESRYKR